MTVVAVREADVRISTDRDKTDHKIIQFTREIHTHVMARAWSVGRMMLLMVVVDRKIQLHAHMSACVCVRVTAGVRLSCEFDLRVVSPCERTHNMINASFAVY